MIDRLSSKDLQESDDCGNCGSPMTIHAVPLGNPMFLVRTGWCESCQRARFSLDGCGHDVRSAANQLVSTLRRTFGAD